MSQDLKESTISELGDMKLGVDFKDKDSKVWLSEIMTAPELRNLRDLLANPRVKESHRLLCEVLAEDLKLTFEQARDMIGKAWIHALVTITKERSTK